MKKVIIVGSGAGGAAISRELAGYFDVTILEAGGNFKPFPYRLSFFEKFKKTGLLFNEREIQLIFPFMRVRQTTDQIVVINGKGVGGSTTISAGNAIRQDRHLKDIGVNLDTEFTQLYQDIPITTAHARLWRPLTRSIFEICREMGLDPRPTPKMGNYDRCRNCGQCILGCPYRIKWDSRYFLREALAKGARIIKNATVRKLFIRDSQVKGVQIKNRFSSTQLAADIIILAAGGLGTPLILQESGIACKPHLFLDPVLCVAAEWSDAFNNKELSMPFVVQQDRFILSPYFDHLSFYFNSNWHFPSQNIISLMIKLADRNQGSVSDRGIDKNLTESDRHCLEQGVDLCRSIFQKLDIPEKSLFLGTINAGHPGGMLPLNDTDSQTLHPSVLPENVYAADASLLPQSLGNPPSLTIMALATRIGKVIKQKYAG